MTAYHTCPVERVPDLWPAVLPLVETGLVNDWTSEQLHAELIAGRAHLWYATDSGGTIRAILVASIHSYPASRACQVWVVAGSLPDNWSAFLTYLEHWARAQGCSRLSLYGRPGWERKLRRLGWGVRSVWMERELDLLPKVQ